MASMLGDSTWGWKIQYMFGSVKMNLEDSGLGWKVQRVGKKIHRGGRRFKVGLEDSKWGKKIQSGGESTSGDRGGDSNTSLSLDTAIP